MALPSDWASVDIIHPSLPTIVASSDLFDGELFGDELIDIYDSAVDTHNANDEIGNLLIPTDLKKGEDAEQMICSMDDGFGTFRPSTSYNDLSSLLSPPVAPVSDSTKADVTVKGSKKRSADQLTSPSSPKRKVANARRGSTSKKDTTSAKKSSKDSEAKVVLSSPVIIESLSRIKDAPIPKHITAILTSTTLSSTTMDSSAGLADEDDVDFKGTAQAAVSNLINSAGSEVPESENCISGEKVDTSTAHIRALTGNNWVAACSGTAQGIASVSSDTDSKTGGCNRNRHRQNMTPDERARQNRDRNREHARNTRLRKKAYVEELKRTLTELVSQRDASDVEKRHSAQRELEQREVRFRVIEEFLKLRGRNESNFARWAAILEDGFSLTLPSMDFRKTAQDDSHPAFEITLSGVSDVMANAIVFSEFLQTLGPKEGVVSCQFQCDRKKFFMDGCQAVLEWSSTTVGAVAKGASSELFIKGIVRGKFSPDSNKLISASLTCDTGAIMMQLQRNAVGTSFEAAQVAASQADAILDSLQMPCLSSTVSSAVIVDSSSSSSEGSGDEESDGEQGEKTKSAASSVGMDPLSA